MTDQDYPALYRSADAVAASAQTHFFKILALNLFLLIASAALSVFDLPVFEIAYAQAAVLLLSLCCAIYLGLVRPEKIWYSGRALAESVKTITWRYMMKAEPYNSSDSDARRVFIEVLKKLVVSNQDVSKKTIDCGAGTQVTDLMIAVRASSFVERKEYYRAQRITDQLEWYQRKAKINETAARNFFVALCAANVIAIVFALLKIRFPEAEFWPTDILVAAAGAVLAWTQAKRYRELSASYALTAHEISLIREQLFEISSEIKFSDFVGDSENAFSREHTQWIARRDA